MLVMSRKTVLGKLVSLFLGLSVIVLTQPMEAARAAVITVDFSGIINSVADGAGTLAGTGITAGTSTFSGSFSYDTATAASSLGTNIAGYPGGLFTVTIDGTYVLSDDPSVITITDDFGTSSRDGFFIGSAGSAADRFDLPVTASYQYFINLFDSTGSVFSSTALPNSLNLGQFDTAVFSIVEFGGGYDIDGVIQSLAVRSVPEPATLILLGFGLAGVGFMRRKRVS